MFRKFLNTLENPDYPLLGPNIKGLEFTGMLVSKNKFRRFCQIFIHITATLFVLSQYVELWIIRSDLESALRNLSISMLSTVCVVKSWTYIAWKRHWNNINESVSNVERRQLAKKDDESFEIIQQYINYSRIVTYLYWCLVTATVFTVILSPLAVFISSSEYREKIRDGIVPYPEIMSSWLPFDKTFGVGYFFYILEHTLICFYGGGVVATYDSNAVALMTFFAGQIKILKSDCVKIFNENDKKEYSDQDAMSRIRDCHHHHLFLIKYSKILNSLLSPVMFLYIFICSLMICASAVQLTNDGTTRMQQIWIAEYLMALIAQLFLYCWHGNEVAFSSEQADSGVYQSDWWKRNPRLRKSILLLGGQLKNKIIFNAGPFTTLTIPTFVTIIKGSYSYYAILSKNEVVEA